MTDQYPAVEASQRRYGKRLRWARKIVRDWERSLEPVQWTNAGPVPHPKYRARYERATALLLAEALRAR